MNEILISRSIDFKDYEILIRQRGNYEYTAYSPQLNVMVKAKDIITAKELLFKKINQHINYNLKNPEVVEEYYKKIEKHISKKRQFVFDNLKKNNEINDNSLNVDSENISEIENNIDEESNIDEVKISDINNNKENDFNELNFDELENINTLD